MYLSLSHTTKGYSEVKPVERKKENTKSFTPCRVLEVGALIMEGQEPANKTGKSKSNKKATTKTVAVNMLPEVRVCRIDDVFPATATVVTEQTKWVEPPPSVRLETKEDACDPVFLNYCMDKPILLAHGLGSAVNLNMDLFSTKTLMETSPEHPVEVRTQIYQSGHQNWENGVQTWQCTSSTPADTTIQKFSAYQDNCRAEKVPSDKAHYRNQGKTRTIRFGTNVDLCDRTLWKEQLDELEKLPPFLRVSSPGSMLSHMGYEILGMNTVQVYLKVPGSRTPGHQENNNFCSVNINIGPGDTEWFAVPELYWQELLKLCQKNGLDFLSGSWWPNLDDLQKARIPVFRFLQRPGDLVWVNVGCVHWAQAIGSCNNLAWNVGPLTGNQYDMAIDRYEWNKLHHYKSLVPMINLSWNLACKVLISDPLLYNPIKECLQESMFKCMTTINFLHKHGVRVKYHGRTPGEPTNYCVDCKIEVFSLLFVARDVGTVVYCFDCARKQSPHLHEYDCLQEFKMETLMDIHDKFVLFKKADSEKTRTEIDVAQLT